MSVLSLIDQIASTSKTNEKKAILESIVGTDHETTFKLVCHMTYDPQYNYWMSAFEMPTAFTGVINLHDALISLREIITKRQITGHTAQGWVSDLAGNLTEEDAQVLYKVIQRDLKCGISATTINKIWSDLIYQHPYMRCSSFSEKNLKYISYPCLSQMKADGLYCDLFVYSDSICMMTRNGSTFDLTGFDQDKKQYLCETYSGYVIQGELLVQVENGTGWLPRAEGNGILNSDSIPWDRVYLEAWDIVPIDQFEAGKGTETYIDRYTNLLDRTNKIDSFCYFVIPIETVVCENADQVFDHFKKKREQGFEGTVIKDHSGLWAKGTSKYQVKVKVVADCDLVIVGYKEGSGKHAGKLGAFACASSDGLLKTSIGGGYKDSDREKFWKDPDSYLGKIIAVKFNDVVKNQNEDSTYSLFLPRAIEVRSDKTEADSLEQIQEQIASFVDALRML